LESFWRDVKLAVRILRRHAGFSALAITVLALAIGANAAIFSVVRGVLLREPAFRDPGRLVMVWEAFPARGRDRNVAGPYNFIRWRERARSFTDMAAFTDWQGNLAGGGLASPERVDIGVVTGNLFDVLGVSAFAGRTLTEADSRPGAPNVTVLGEAYWRRRFAADPAVIGRTVLLNGEPATVVGVMAQSFQLPPGMAAWSPITLDDKLRNARGRWMKVVARLRPEATVAQAREEMARLSADLVRENPSFDTGWTSNVFPMHADLVRTVRPALVVLMSAVGLLLLVACANVANLLLARALGREREMAVRAALGANPARILRQLLTESVLLAVAGGLAGLVLGVWVLQGLVALLPEEVRLMGRIGLDPAVLAFTGGVSVLSALAFGLLPALHQVMPSLVAALKEGGRTRGASRGHRRLKSALVIGEVALSLVLTAGTGLLLRSFWKLTHVDPGFRADGVLTVPVDLAGPAYEKPERQAAFFRDAVDRLARLPGATAAGAISWIPFSTGSATSFRAADRPLPAPGQSPGGDVRMITPGLLRTMSIPILAGRDFEKADAAGKRDVVIVNRAVADEFWPGGDALGKHIVMDWGRTIDAEVVGVVGDVRLKSLDTAPRLTLYWPMEQVPNGFATLMVKTSLPPESLAPAVRGALAAIDPELPPGQFRTLEQVVEASLERPLFLLRLLGAFGLIALVLAGVGLYGVVSYSVMERVPEVGVRLAVGASPGDIVRLVLRDGLALGAAGVVAGLLLTAGAAGLVESLLFEVGPRDPVALSTVSLLLLAATLAAAWLPARRASRVDPVEALRGE